MHMPMPLVWLLVLAYPLAPHVSYGTHGNAFAELLLVLADRLPVSCGTTVNPESQLGRPASCPPSGIVALG